jgi:hypothetical protein
MVCAFCNQPNVVWRGPLSDLTHTECPDCGRINCQRVDEPEDEEGDQ